MMKNKKPLIGFLVVGFLMVSGWWIWNQVTCTNHCVGDRITYCSPSYFGCWCYGLAECSKYCGAGCESDGDCSKGFVCGFENCECIPEIQAEKQVTLTTDKIEYEQGEKMKITIENKREIPIYLEKESYTYSDEIYQMKIEKYENILWNTTGYAFSDQIRCMPGEQGPVIACVEMKEGEKLERVKSLSYLKCVGEFPQMKSEEFPLPLGRYRLKINFGEKCWAGTGYVAPSIIYSNEFIVRE